MFGVRNTDESDESGASDDEEEGYFIAARSGDSHTDKTLHVREDCPVAIRSTGGVRPLNPSAVADEYDRDWCHRCAPDRGDAYPLPDPDGFELVENGDEYLLHTPGDLRIKFDAVREHEDAPQIVELLRDRQVVADALDLSSWPKSVRERLEQIDAPAPRTHPRA